MKLTRFKRGKHRALHTGKNNHTDCIPKNSFHIVLSTYKLSATVIHILTLSKNLDIEPNDFLDQQYIHLIRTFIITVSFLFLFTKKPFIYLIGQSPIMLCQRQKNHAFSFTGLRTRFGPQIQKESWLRKFLLPTDL